MIVNIFNIYLVVFYKDKAIKLRKKNPGNKSNKYIMWQLNTKNKWEDKDYDYPGSTVC